MAMLHEEVDAVLLGSDGIGVGLGDSLDNLKAFHVELISSRCSLVGADSSGDDDRGLLGEAFEGLENLRGDALYVGHALDGAGAVAKDGKEELAALAEVVEPAAEGDGLAFMLADGGDSSDWGWDGFFGHRVPQRALSAGQIRIARAVA
jgi:hypothetical protein